MERIVSRVLAQMNRPSLRYGTLQRLLKMR
jgi:hypothetical protein